MNHLIHQQITGAGGGCSAAAASHPAWPLLLMWHAHLFTAAIKSWNWLHLCNRDATDPHSRMIQMCIITPVIWNSDDPVVQTAGMSDPYKLVLVARIKLISTKLLAPLTCHRHLCLLMVLTASLHVWLFPFITKKLTIFIPPKSSQCSYRWSVMSWTPPRHLK